MKNREEREEEESGHAKVEEERRENEMRIQIWARIRSPPSFGLTP